MNFPLYWAALKSHIKKAVIYSGGIVLYNGILIGIYPRLSCSKNLEEVSLHLPRSVKRVFGLSSDEGLNSFEAYTASQCFGQIWNISMGIFVVTTAYELIGRLINQGSMACLLSSPINRASVYFTQVAVMTSIVILSAGVVVTGAWLSARLWKVSIDPAACLFLGAMMAALFSLIGSYTLFLSVFLRNEEMAVGAAVSLTLFFYGLDIFSELDEKFSGVKRFSIFSWMQNQKILEGEWPFKLLIGMVGITTALILAGERIFRIKDMAI